MPRRANQHAVFTVVNAGKKYAYIGSHSNTRIRFIGSQLIPIIFTTFIRFSVRILSLRHTSPRNSANCYANHLLQHYF